MVEVWNFQSISSYTYCFRHVALSCDTKIIAPYFHVPIRAAFLEFVNIIFSRLSLVHF